MPLHFNALSTDHLAVNQAAIDNTLAVKREPIAALNFSNAEPQLWRIVASLTEASTEGGHRNVLPFSDGNLPKLPAVAPRPHSCGVPHVQQDEEPPYSGPGVLPRPHFDGEEVQALWLGSLWGQLQAPRFRWMTQMALKRIETEEASPP